MLEEKLIYHSAWRDTLRLSHTAFYQMGSQATLPLRRLAMANVQEKRTERTGTNRRSQYLFHLIKLNKTRFQNIL